MRQIYDPPLVVSSVTAVLYEGSNPCTANALCQLDIAGSGFVFTIGNGNCGWSLDDTCDTQLVIVETNQLMGAGTPSSSPPPWTQLEAPFNLPAGIYTVKVTNKYVANGQNATAMATFTVNP